MGIKISELDSREMVTDNDLIPIVNMDDTESPATQKATVSDLFKAILPQNAGTHNSIFRGENITDLWYNGTVSEDIANGTFANEFIGDYIVGETSENIYRIAHLNYYYNRGNPTKLTTPHIVFVSEDILGDTKQMNSSDTTEGAYVGSEMYTTNLEDAKTIITNDFGSSHLLNHYVMFANGVNSTYENSTTTVNTCIYLMNEFMVFGSNIYHNMSKSSGTAIPTKDTLDCLQLQLFALAPEFIRTSMTYWLRDVVNGGGFCVVNANGYNSSGGSSGTKGVRPCFTIY